MRILYLHQYFNLPSMSGGTRSFEMARRFVEWGHEVHMITSDRSNQNTSSTWRVTTEAGMTVHWLAVPYSNRLSYQERIRSFFKFAWGAATRAAAIPADVVFATSTPLTIALPAIYAARRQRIPMVFEVRDLWPDLPIVIGALRGSLPIMLARWLEKFAYDNSSAVVALSPGMKEGVVRRGYPEARVHVIPNSCDLDLFQVSPEAGKAFRSRYAWLGERPLMLYAGAFGKVNDVGYMAKLASVVQSLMPDVRFLAVGDGAEFDAVQTLAQELGVLNKNFFVLPKIPKADIPALFSAATVVSTLLVTIPGRIWDNSSNKFFDGLAAGRPVVTNYGGWQADLLRMCGAGVVLNEYDIPQAAQQLVDFLTDEQKLAHAGEAALRLAHERFARDNLARQLEKVLISTTL
ncbi:colanic acid biosynthesis glycosyl transferase WcaI [Gammaproteobacteria bacterium]